MSNFYEERVLSVHHWTDTLFSFTTTRDASFRFKNGQFTMIGLKVDEKPLLRAYSLASTNYDEDLEFFSIKVPDGPLTSRLQNLKVGDPIIVGKKAVGTLVLDNLKDGKRLFLLGTGTGLAPFLALIRDPETYERYRQVVLVHGCRQVAELAYGERIQSELPQDEFLGEAIRSQLTYYPTVTREPFRNRGRITDLLTSGQLFSDIGQPGFDPEGDRFMLCGSPQMLADLKAIFEERGLTEGNTGEPGDYVIEKAFVEK
jgi:ferredoxin/flavodoxin---NADP+ reductase